MLAYLAHTRRTHRRDSLATLLWEDRPQSQAMGNLRVLLSSLRKQLPQFTLIERHTVSLNFDAEIFVDSLALIDAAIAAKHHYQTPKQLLPVQASDLESAVSLYTGDFLAGFHIRDSLGFEEWVSLTREQVRMAVLDGLYLLLAHHTAANHLREAIATAERIIAIDPLQEAAHRAVMRLLALNGLRNAAIRRYKACVDVLDAELGVEPHPQTIELYDRIVDMNRMPAIALPSQPTPFLGREAECADIRRRLADDNCRLLTLTGPGGIGKTRLALETARRTRPMFLHSAAFVPLEQVEANTEVVPAIARAFGFPVDDDAPEASLWDFLREKELLLVLDNFEHLPASAATIIHQLIKEAPLIKILITSRKPLALRAEWVYSVSGFPLPASNPAAIAASDAGQLFVQSAQRGASFAPNDDDFCAIGEICRLVNGLPLGVELAATWVRVFSCAEIVRNIATDLDFLSAPAVDRPARHDSLRVVFEQSWGLLTDAERQALLRMAIFRAPFSLAAAVAVAKISARQLPPLVDASFLIAQPEHDTFDMHPLMKQFVGHKLDARPQLKAEAQQRHAVFYANFLHSQEDALRSAETAQAEQAIERAEENIRAAWDWAVNNGNDAIIEKGAESLYLYLWKRGRIQEGKRRMQDAAQAVISAGKSDFLAANLRLFAAEFQAWHTEYETAIHTLNECIAVFEAQSAHRQLSQARDLLGRVAYWQGDYAAAQTYFEQATVDARHADTPFELAQALCSLANAICENSADYDAAHGFYAESLALAKKLGDAHGVAKVTINLGAAAQELGQLERARILFDESLTQYRHINYRHGIAAALTYLGEVALAQGKPDNARHYMEESLQLSREAGDRQSMVGILVSLGKLNTQHGDFPQAQFRIRQGLRMALALDAPQWVAQSLLAWAELQHARNNPETALIVLSWLVAQSDFGEEFSRKIGPVFENVASAVPRPCKKPAAPKQNRQTGRPSSRWFCKISRSINPVFFLAAQKIDALRLAHSRRIVRHGSVKFGVIGASLHHHRHRHGVPHDERLLFGVEPRQHFAQAFRTIDARQHGANVAVVVQQCRHPRANLAHHFFINAGWTLVNHQQSHIIFA